MKVTYYSYFVYVYIFLNIFFPELPDFPDSVFLILPGNISMDFDSSIFSRMSSYCCAFKLNVKSRLIDLGL